MEVVLIKKCLQNLKKYVRIGHAMRAQLSWLERNLAKVEVEGSSPFARTKVYKNRPFGRFFDFVSKGASCEARQQSCRSTLLAPKFIKTVHLGGFLILSAKGRVARRGNKVVIRLNHRVCVVCFFRYDLIIMNNIMELKSRVMLSETII